MAELSTRLVRQLPGRIFSIVLETLPDDPFPMCPATDFDAYICLDPTLANDRLVHAFPRPLAAAAIANSSSQGSPDIPVIGSFGFPTPGKGFERVIDAVNREFDRAVVRLNIPSGDFTGSTVNLHGQDYTNYLENLCRTVAKPGIDVQVTRRFMEPDELIRWCGENTLNCFLYDRLQPGLSATTDQAIISGRPLAVSDNPTFRHIHRYLPPYPRRSLKASIAQSAAEVRTMQAEWSAPAFLARFEDLLRDFRLLPRSAADSLGVPRAGQPRILIISHKAVRCGIHEYGINTFNALRKSERYSVHYAECSSADEFRVHLAYVKPDLLLVNYYPFTMPWFTPEMAAGLTMPKLHIWHEVTQELADSIGETAFDFHICQDPTLEERNPNVFRVGRLIPDYTNAKPKPPIPIIGSFGFAGANKGFERLVLLVQDEFDEAVIRLNIPVNDAVDINGAMAFETAERCRSLVMKPGIHLVIGHNYLERPALLDMLAEHSLNVFLYDNPEAKGISSVIDYAIAAGRPIAVTRSPMFRHLKSLTPSVFVEDRSLRAIMADGMLPLVPLRNEWGEQRLILRYEEIFDRVLGRSPVVTDPAPLSIGPGASPAVPRPAVQVSYDGLVSQTPPYLLPRKETMAGRLATKYNRILDDDARTIYLPAIRMLFAACPDIMQRKIPEANVQQAFVLDAVLNFIEGRHNPRILCVGAFEDTASATLKTCGYAVDEIDPAVNMDLRTFMGLPITRKASYDLVFSTSVIEHVPDDETFVEDICTLLKDGGIAVLTMDFKNHYRPGDPSPLVDERLYTPADIIDRLMSKMPGCKLVDEPNWHQGVPDFCYENVMYNFASMVVRKEPA
jgi:SAM-dependent methyltransferase